MHLNNKNNIVGVFEIPYIQDITEPVLKALQSKKDGEKIYIDIHHKILHRMMHMDNFSIEKYLIARTQEQIASKIFEILTYQECKLTLTDISTDIIGGYDMKMRIKGVNYKFQALESVDITLDYKRYLHKKSTHKADRNAIHILYMPSKIIEHVYFSLSQNNTSNTPLEKRLFTIMKTYLGNTSELYNPKAIHYNPKTKTETLYSIREFLAWAKT